MALTESTATAVEACATAHSEENVTAIGEMALSQLDHLDQLQIYHLNT